MFTLPELPFALSALEPHIDTQTMEIHHGKHHAAYVKNLNEVLSDKDESNLSEILTNIDLLPENIRTKVRNNGGGHWNHSFFWSILSPDSSNMSSELSDSLIMAYGSIEAFKEKFIAAGLSRFGSGWVWLVRDRGDLSIIDSPNQDNPLMIGKTPILGIDVWEHAYYLRYQNKRVDYLNSIWNVINWNEVSRLFSS